MRIPITPLGRREIAICTLVLFAAALVAFHFFWPVAVVPLILWVGALCFFRDPDRAVGGGRNVLLAPADGTVTDVTRLDDDPQVGGPATRIGIFLSIFSVHINRSPIAGRVTSVTPQSGKFHDARDPRAVAENASNTVLLEPDDESLIGPVAVKQITGLIARRIVCGVKPGDRLEAGQRFGMIKFGSRTELIVPAANSLDVAVKVGQKVKAGLTILATRKAAQSQDQSSGPSAVSLE